MRYFFPLSIAGIACLVLAAQSAAPKVTRAAGTPVYGYKVIHTYPHDPGAFTQGLLYQDGFLWEGTGQRGASSIRKVDLTTGKVLRKADLTGDYFGEGIVLWKNRLIELTWQSQIGFVYDRETFRMLNTFIYRTEGWGITHDGKRLIMSDGTDALYFWNPETFAEIGRIHVSDRGRSIQSLNELEYIHGEIWANIWQTDRIARISPATGQVTGWIDLTGLKPAGAGDVLNGIAWDAKTDRVFVTGKWWPKLFEIQLVPR